VTNLLKRMPSRCRKGQDCSHEPDDGNYRARDAQVLPVAGIDDGVNDFPVGEVPRPGELARGSIQNSDSSPAEIGISPIKTVEFYFSNWSSDTKIVNRGICPGTPLVLSRPESGQPQPGRVGENRDQGARSEAGHHCFFFAGRYFFSIDATTT